MRRVDKQVIGLGQHSRPAALVTVVCHSAEWFNNSRLAARSGS
jgi:hypothetical protein